jgi:hypothetical protein
LEPGVRGSVFVGAFGRNLASVAVKIFSYLTYFIKKLVECPQCYCEEIRQMFTCIIDLYCPKAYHRPGHSIRIVEYHKKDYYYP